MSASDIARMLAGASSSSSLISYRPGIERAMSGAQGASPASLGDGLGLHLTGAKAGIWADFSSGQRGDTLDLVATALQLEMSDAIG